MQLAGGSPLLLGYLFAYGAAGAGCLIALRRARRIEDRETRLGLVGLLAGSGGWAVLEFGFLAAPTPGLAEAAYLASLVVGFTTVFWWLYFCSAYTGRSFHRNRTYRLAAVGLYLGVVVLKLTNPVHGLYFQTRFVTTPFPHLAVGHGTIHWIVTGLSYALATVGIFMVYELFLEADYDTRPLAAVVAATALPVVLDLVGFATPRLLDVNYEPLGVVLFAVGALYVFEDRFLAVQVTAGVDEPVVYLDSDGVVREYNDRARRALPPLAGATGEPLSAALPEAAETLDAGGSSILRRRRNGERRYYLVSETTFTLGQAEVGRLVVFSDVTDAERRRRELRRHNEQLEGFAAAVRHELLNTVQMIDAWIAAAGRALDRGDVAEANEALRKASAASDRTVGVVDDLATVAQYGRTPERTEPVEFGRAVEAAFGDAATGGLELVVEGEGELEADGIRLAALLERAFAFAAHNDASSVTATLEEDGFAVADDGRPPGDLDPEAYLEYGEAVPDAEAGMILPVVRTLARSLGWTVSIDSDYGEGVRIVVSGIAVRQRRRATA